MEVNDCWNDRGAPERVDQKKLKHGAGQMEQPVQMETGFVC